MHIMRQHKHLYATALHCTSHSTSTLHTCTPLYCIALPGTTPTVTRSCRRASATRRAAAAASRRASVPTTSQTCSASSAPHASPASATDQRCGGDGSMHSMRGSVCSVRAAARLPAARSSAAATLQAPVAALCCHRCCLADQPQRRRRRAFTACMERCLTCWPSRRRRPGSARLPTRPPRLLAAGWAPLRIPTRHSAAPRLQPRPCLASTPPGAALCLPRTLHGLISTTRAQRPTDRCAAPTRACVLCCAHTAAVGVRVVSQSLSCGMPGSAFLACCSHS